MKVPGAAEFIPPEADWDSLRRASQGCRGCDLYRGATQAVFGEGPRPAPMMMIGEQPGDREDRAGHPFVGPAGLLLDRALAEVGLDRQAVYLTNAVKHFKFEERGKRRIHKQPSRTEVVACGPWLAAEFELVRPKLVVCLGAVAAKGVFGPTFKVSKQRGQVISMPDYSGVATLHPSSVLRAPDRDEAYGGFVHDLEQVAAEFERVMARHKAPR